MKTALRASMRDSGFASPALTNCGRKASKKEDLEGERARVQERREAHDRRRHVRDDADRAAEGGDDARRRAAREPCRQRVENEVIRNSTLTGTLLSAEPCGPPECRLWGRHRQGD